MEKEKQEKTKQRKNFMLSDSTMGLLARMDNASRYLDDLVQARQQRAMQSLLHLQSLDWTGAEISACCDVLNGSWQLCEVPRWHGASLSDALYNLRAMGVFDFYAAKFGIGTGRWEQIAAQVSESESVAYALHEVVSEFWCGNTVIEAALRKPT